METPEPTSDLDALINENDFDNVKQYNNINILHKTFTYDKRGNLIGEYQEDELLHGYTFNPMNRLEKAWNKKGEEAEYFYNALGQRTEKNADGETEHYLLDLTKPYHNLLELQKGKQIQTFFWDFNVAVMEDEKRNLQYYLQDDLGSPLRVLYKNGYGEAYGYDEFGTDLYDPEKEQNARKKYGKQGTHQPFGYTGYRYDNISGSYFAQAREYTPEVGRFIGEDINKGNSAIPDTLNPYNYCKNNSLKYVDYDGKVYIIAWSYGSGDAKDFEEYMNKNFDTDLTVDGDTSDWTKDVYDEWDERNSFSRAAHTKAEELIESGVSEDNIEVVRIDNKDDLEKQWEIWKNYDNIEGLDFYSHGYSEGAEVYKGSGDFWTYADTLNFTANAEAIFYGCNTANGKFAQYFANKQHVITYAQIDYASFSHDPVVRQRIKTFDTTLEVYLYPYTWGYKEFRIEFNLFGLTIPYSQFYFNEWNFKGKGKRFEPCE